MADEATTNEAKPNKTPVYALSVCGRLTMNLHSLNNEGTEGNQQITRMVTVADQNGAPQTVNAVSGDMFKHIQVEHLTGLVVRDGLPICEPARLRHPGRIANVERLAARDVKDAAVTDTILERCTVTDLAGTLLTDNRSTARNSVIEWGWVVGVPEKTTTESFIHLKRVPDAGEIESGSAGNQGQNIFHRPANSGVYAAVVNVEAYRVGFNDLTRQVPEKVKANREARYKALLQSLLYTFLEPNGAQRNTQNPHISGFEGVVSISRDVCPAPTVSPLNEGYREQMEQVAMTLSELLKDRQTKDGQDEKTKVESGQDKKAEDEKMAVEVRRFGTLAEFAVILSNLIQTTTPYEIGAAKAETKA